MAKTDNLTDFLTGVAGSLSPAKPEQSKDVGLDMASGSQVVEPDTGKVLSSVTIYKPPTMTADNIRKGIDIGGVTGTYEGESSGGDRYKTFATVDITTPGRNPATVAFINEAKTADISTITRIDYVETYVDEMVVVIPSAAWKATCTGVILKNSIDASGNANGGAGAPLVAIVTRSSATIDITAS